MIYSMEGHSGLNVSSMNSLGLQNLWERYWFGPVAAIRPYLLIKVVLVLLALDEWVFRAPGGSRYGADGFNVAHFKWLDALQPVPTTDVYVSVVLGTGILALVCALLGSSRFFIALLALLYTYGWAMSMWDSFQHHYFLSLVLTLFIFFPRLDFHGLYSELPEITSKQESTARAGQLINAWAYALLGVNVALLYAFTVVTKFETQWRNGMVLRGFAGPRELFEPMEYWLAKFDITTSEFWSGIAWSVIITEIIIVLGYLLAVRRDSVRRAPLKVFIWLGFMAAIGLHIVNEMIRLHIGWFSYYMIAFAAIYFLPANVLWALGRILTTPGRFFIRTKFSVRFDFFRHRTVSLAASLIVGLTIGSLAPELDVAGARILGWITAVLLILFGVFNGLFGNPQNTLRYASAVAIAWLVMGITISHSMARFDYGIFLGLIKQRQGIVEGATLYLISRIIF